MEIRAAPHPGQVEVHNSPARFKVLAAGRRWGKTRLGVNECLDVASTGGRAWWVSPNYKMSEVGWRPLRQLSRRVPGATIKLADRVVEFSGGGFVAVRSADNPDSLRGEGLNFVVMDEAAFMSREAWTEAIRPALSDRQGRSLFISTPKGRNWFWEIYQRGVNGEDGWQSWTFPTADNPYIDPAEVEAARRELPDIIFRQEYLAEFVDDQGAVFRRVQDAARLHPLDRAIEGRQYVAAVDPASATDYTAVCVLDVESKQQVYLDRFNRVDYPVLEDRLAAVYDRFRLDRMRVEGNSIGAPVFDHLAARGLRVEAFTTTNATKATIIQQLMAAFEHEQIAILDDQVQTGELLSFESKKTASGAMTYSAPSGVHDDTVMALAMAWDMVAGNPPITVIDDPFAGW